MNIEFAEIKFIKGIRKKNKIFLPKFVLSVYYSIKVFINLCNFLLYFD